MSLLVALAGCAPRTAVRVERAWVRAADSAATSAAYFTFVNDSNQPVQLAGIAASCARRVEMHETVREGGVASMRKMDTLEVPAHERVEFAPGGRHVMLISMVRRLAADDTASLVVELDGGRTVEMMAEVRE